MEKKSNNTSRELEQWNCTSVERKIYHSVTEWTSLLIAIGTTCFSNLLDIVLAHSFNNHDSQLTILQLHFKSISIVFSYHCRCNSCFVYILHLIFYDLNEQRYHNDCKRHSILPSFQSSLYLRKKLEKLDICQSQLEELQRELFRWLGVLNNFFPLCG